MNPQGQLIAKTLARRKGGPLASHPFVWVGRSSLLEVKSERQLELPVRSGTNCVGDRLSEGAEVAACTTLGCICVAGLNTWQSARLIGSGGHGIGQSDLRAAHSVVTWYLVFRMVEDVVALCPEFDVLALCDRELLRKGQIQLVDAGASEGIPR